MKVGEVIIKQLGQECLVSLTLFNVYMPSLEEDFGKEQRGEAIIRMKDNNNVSRWYSITGRLKERTEKYVEKVFKTSRQRGMLLYPKKTKHWFSKYEKAKLKE